MEARHEQRYTEMRILILYTLYSVAMIIAAVSLDWDRWIIPIILTAGVVAWGIYLKDYKTYRYRSFLVTVLAMMNFIIYGICAVDFLGMIPAMGVLAVMLAIYGVAENIYIVMLCSALVLLYHIICVGDISIKPTVLQNCRQMIELISAFIIEYLAFYLVCKQASDKQRLIDVIDRLEVAEQSKNDFLSNMSHELRTPINTVTGMSELVLQKELRPEIREDVFDIQIAGRSLLSLVTDILDYTELESGHVELVEEPYNIISTVNDVINIALAQNQEKNLELIVDCDATLPCSLLGDEQKIRRVMANLVGNAVKFTNKGCVTILVTYRREEYGINLNVSIKDTGIGMEQQEIDRLFHGFYQVDAKRSRREEGIGLGLTICNGLVHRMGGFLTVHSDVGHGSEFQFSLPQKVLDPAPAITIERLEAIHVVVYFDLEKYTFEDTRDDYLRSMWRMSDTLGIVITLCRSHTELARKMQENHYTHLFTGANEYHVEPEYFEKMSEDLVVTVIADRSESLPENSRIVFLHKPFYAMSIANVLNGRPNENNFGENQNQYKPFVAPEAKILIVDDNIMNLKVAEGLLLQYKVKIATAISGEEALVKIEDMDYDFVFMDHMMPGMDGVETLHRIRRKPGRYFQTVPIVALTANAIGGAREMFLQEGFQDFVAKPIDLTYLERVLRKYIPESKIIAVEEYEKMGKQAGENGAVPEDSVKKGENSRKEETQKRQDPEREDTQEPGTDVPSGHADATDPVPDASEDTDMTVLREAGIDVEQALGYFDGDRDMYREISEIFCDGIEEKIQELETCLKEENWKDYTVYVHAVKSTALTVGAVTLSGMAKDLETAGKKEDADTIRAGHEPMIREYRRTIRIFREWQSGGKDIETQESEMGGADH